MGRGSFARPVPLASAAVPAFWTDRRVVVTGGAGFLGQAVQAGLGARGADHVLAPSSVDYDLRDRGAVAQLFGELQPDLVIHLAARVGGIGANQAHPADLYLDNLLMGTYVIDEARIRETPKIVVVGTICSYPRITPVPFSEDSLWQGYPEETNAPYGIAKLTQLVQLQSNRAQYGQNGIYLLPTNLYGPGDKFHPAVSHVIPALIKKCIDAVETGADHIEVWGTGSASREFLYVDDAAEGILLAAEHYEGEEPVNLGAQREMPIKELVELIAELTSFDGEIRWDTSKPDGQPRRCVDPSRAEAEFGFRATTDFREGLARTIAWYRENRDVAEARER
jgi:GDP-L-fucose synthase